MDHVVRKSTHWIPAQALNKRLHLIASLRGLARQEIEVHECHDIPWLFYASSYLSVLTPFVKGTPRKVFCVPPSLFLPRSTTSSFRQLFLAHFRTCITHSAQAAVLITLDMPYSDNLYSANDDESDNESFSNELSPTDGFFNQSPMSPSHMVPDPSLDRKDREEEDKVLIPRNETRNESGSASRSTTSPTLGQLFPSQNYASSQSNNHPAPLLPSSNTPSSPSSYRRTENNISSGPNNSMQGPPPAYTPSSPTTSSHSTHNNRSYSTFEPRRLEQGLASEPQSMGRPADDPDERTPLSENPVRKLSRRRLFIKKSLFVALVIAVVIGAMTTFLNWGQSVCTHISSTTIPASPT